MQDYITDIIMYILLLIILISQRKTKNNYQDTFTT